MVNSADSKTEERIASINYVITFYKDLQQLLHFYSIYADTLVENKALIEGGKLAEEQKLHIRNLIVNVRYYARKCKLFVNAMATEAKIKDANKKAIEEYFNQFKSDFIPKEEALENYVSELNKFFVTNVAKEILQNNAELISQIYSIKVTGGNNDSN